MEINYDILTNQNQLFLEWDEIYEEIKDMLSLTLLCSVMVLDKPGYASPESDSLYWPSTKNHSVFDFFIFAHSETVKKLNVIQLSQNSNSV